MEGKRHEEGNEEEEQEVSQEGVLVIYRAKWARNYAGKGNPHQKEPTKKQNEDLREKGRDETDVYLLLAQELTKNHTKKKEAANSLAEIDYRCSQGWTRGYAYPKWDEGRTHRRRRRRKKSRITNGEP